MNNRQTEIRDAVIKQIHSGRSLEDALFLLHLDITELTAEETTLVTQIYSSLKGPDDKPADPTAPSVKTEFLAQMKNSEEVDAMEKELKRRKVTEQFDKYKVADAKADNLKTMDFLATPVGSVERLKAKNTEAFVGFRATKAFIGPMFNGFVPFTQKELILILGQTGGSKSTVVSNLAWSVVKQMNPKTNKLGKVLIITNEETEEDLFNRIACLAMLEKSGCDDSKWWYSERGKFTEEQVQYFNQFIERFKSTGHINVIGLDYGSKDELEFTCCLENVRAILDQVAKNPGCYDCVIIDYYQNIRDSLKKPQANEYEVQRDFVAALNTYKELLGCPLVITAQLNPPSKEKSWKDRIVGSKVVCQPSTFVMEVAANKETLTTEWIFHKVRYADTTVGKLTTGYKFGRIVPKNKEFDTWAAPILASKKTPEAKWKEERARLKMEREDAMLDALLGNGVPTPADKSSKTS